MKKFRLYFDTDKEVEWLNGMAEQGYAMSGYFLGVYTFDKCEPGKYQYQIDNTDGMFRVENSYREFMNEMGIDIVALWGPWVYLRKHTEDGPFELYSDVESRITHYEKILKLYKFGAIIEAVGAVLEMFAGLHGVSVGLVFACLLAALAGAFIRQCFRIREILSGLYSRAGECDNAPIGVVHRKPSLLISLGFLMNAIGLMIPTDGVSGAVGFTKGLFHGVAIGCFILGLIFTFWKREQQ